MDYGFTHHGKVYTPNGTTAIDPVTSDDRNKAIERAELTAWKGQPDRQCGYYAFPSETEQGGVRFYRRDFYPAIAGATVSTWLGTVIGTVIKAHVYPHNFGSRMVALTVRGTNGAIYHGRASWDNGTCISLRRTK
jgi:hypothetical protein